MDAWLKLPWENCSALSDVESDHWRWIPPWYLLSSVTSPWRKDQTAFLLSVFTHLYFWKQCCLFRLFKTSELCLSCIKTFALKNPPFMSTLLPPLLPSLLPICYLASHRRNRRNFMLRLKVLVYHMEYLFQEYQTALQMPVPALYSLLLLFYS